LMACVTASDAIMDRHPGSRNPGDADEGAIPSDAAYHP
jgi:hypothetical protein